MARFEVKVVSMALSEVTDTETGKVYKCKNVWHSREYKGKLFKKVYVNVATVPTKQMKDNWTLPESWEIEKRADGKVVLKGENPIGKVYFTDLAGKTATAMPSEESFEL